MEAARRFLDLGCTGLLFNANDCAAEDLERELMAVSELRPGFIMLQDWDAAGYGLPLDAVVRLFRQIPLFTWLKVETSPAGPKYTEVLEATDGALQVAGGWAVQQLLEGLDRGVHAFMPTGMHHAYVRILRLYESGDRDGARACFERLLPILAFSNQHLDVSIQFFKRLLHAQGIYATPDCRALHKPFDAVQERLCGEFVERALALEEEAAAR